MGCPNLTAADDVRHQQWLVRANTSTGMQTRLWFEPTETHYGIAVKPHGTRGAPDYFKLPRNPRAQKIVGALTLSLFGALCLCLLLYFFGERPFTFFGEGLFAFNGGSIVISTRMAGAVNGTAASSAAVINSAVNTAAGPPSVQQLEGPKLRNARKPAAPIVAEKLGRTANSFAADSSLYLGLQTLPRIVSEYSYTDSGGLIVAFLSPSSPILLEVAQNGKMVSASGPGGEMGPGYLDAPTSSVETMSR